MGRRRAADLQPGEAAEVAGGNRARRVLAGPKVWEAAEAGVAAAEAAEVDGAGKRNRKIGKFKKFGNYLVNCFQPQVWRDGNAA